MAPRSKVYDLPADLRAELDGRLIESGFGDYQGLAGWLGEQGYEIGKSSLHRYGQDLEADFSEAMGDVYRSAELARRLIASDPDEQAALSDASIRINQDTLLRLSIQLRKAQLDPEALAPLLSQIGRATADLARVSISQRKHADAVRKQAETEARAAAEAAAKEAGLDDATAKGIASAIRIYLPDNQRAGTRA